MKVLPKYEGLEIIQRTYKSNFGDYHRYEVNGFDCGGHCADCRAKPQRPCKGLPSVTTFTGAYGGGGGLYKGGINHALDAVFGAYTDKDKKTVQENSWMSDFVRSGDNLSKHEMLRYRQEVEEIPTSGDIAREYGIGVHAALESLLVGDGEVPERYLSGANTILAWLNKGGKDGPYIVEDSEVSVFHPELRYAGQIDCVARCGDRIIIIDWKSGKEIRPEHSMQVAAYAMAYSEMTGLAVSEAWVIKASPITGFDAKQVANLAQAQKAFIALQETKRNADRISWRKADG